MEVSVATNLGAQRVGFVQISTVLVVKKDRGELWNVAEALQRGGHVARVAKVVQAGGAHLRWRPLCVLRRLPSATYDKAQTSGAGENVVVL